MHTMQFLLSRGENLSFFFEQVVVMYYSIKYKPVTKMVPGENLLSLSSRKRYHLVTSFSFPISVGAKA